MLLAGCGQSTVDVALPTPLPPGGVLAACANLVDYLPGMLEGHSSRVVAPKSPLVHAWGSPPIRLRCGVPLPAGFTTSSPFTAQVNGVTWFQHTTATQVHWTAIRHTANVELVVPKSYAAQGGFLVDIGRAIAKTIP